MKFKSKCWVLYLRWDSHGYMYWLQVERLQRSPAEGDMGFWLTASWTWSSSMPWQPKAPTVPWGSWGPALPPGGERGCPVLFCAVWLHLLLHWLQLWVPRYNKDIELLECQREGNEDGEGFSLEGKIYEEQLRSPGWFKHGAEEKPDGGCSPSRGERRGSAELCSVWQRQGRGNGMELCQGRGSWGLGTGSAPDDGGHGTGCPGQWAQSWAASVHCLYNALRQRVCFLNGHMWGQMLDSLILMGPFQLWISWDSIQLCLLPGKREVHNSTLPSWLKNKN